MHTQTQLERKQAQDAKLSRELQSLTSRMLSGELDAITAYYELLQDIQRRMARRTLLPDMAFLQSQRDAFLTALQGVLESAKAANDRGRMRTVIQVAGVLDDPELLLAAQTAYNPEREIVLTDDSDLMAEVLGSWQFGEGGPRSVQEDLKTEWEEGGLFQSGDEPGERPKGAEDIHDAEQDPWY